MKRDVRITVGIALVFFTTVFASYSAGMSEGRHREGQQQVADYNDGWTDGQRDLLDQQWNAHFAGKACK